MSPDKLYSRNAEQADLARGQVARLAALGQRAAEAKGRRVRVMEVCGTHTASLARSGISDLASGFMDLRSGPGCPVCVTHQDELDYVIELGARSGATVVTFGDMLRVPGSGSTLEREKARGADIRICHSPLEAVEAAVQNPNKQLVLLAIGFETTAPTIAVSVLEADRLGLKNFSVYSTMKLIPPALMALLSQPHGLDGLLLPGHVSTVLGRKAFGFLADTYGIPAVIAGFAPSDLMAGLGTLMGAVMSDKPEVLNAYSHVVTEEGNPLARETVARCFEPVPETRWRGLGVVPRSGLDLRPVFDSYNVTHRFGLPGVGSGEHVDAGCACGDIIMAKSLPAECSLFGTACTPESPVGPCMVSSEGACNAYYQYRRQQE